MAWALTADYDGGMRGKALFYVSLLASAVFALGAVSDAIESKWRGAGLFGAAAVVWLIMAFLQRKTTNAPRA